MTDAFGGSRIRARPPERGIFPLDHDGECKTQMRAFLDCLKTSKSEHNACKALSKGYLECRMDHELMAREDLANLGLGSGPENQYVRREGNEGEKEAKGFVAGTGVKSSNKRGGAWFG